jgi:nicotinamide-nucleotide amidase
LRGDGCVDGLAMSDAALMAEAAAVLAACRAHKITLATAESCTGGLIAGCLTDVPGSSDVVDRGFVAYSNAAKTELLGVPAALIATHGAVSAAVARAMAEGALAHAPVQVAVAATGIVGPGGGTAAKPVGLVHLACARSGKATIERECRFGDVGRNQVRRESVAAALAMLRQQLEI